jgi:hypothetical protein
VTIRSASLDRVGRMGRMGRMGMTGMTGSFAPEATPSVTVRSDTQHTNSDPYVFMVYVSVPGG